MLPLTKQELQLHQDATEFYICRQNVTTSMSWRKYWKIKNFLSCNRKRNLKFYKDSNKNIVTTSYIIKLTYSERFMASSLSNLVRNLTEEIHKIKYKDCDCFFEYENVNGNLINNKFLSCN